MGVLLSGPIDGNGGRVSPQTKAPVTKGKAPIAAPKAGPVPPKAAAIVKLGKKSSPQSPALYTAAGVTKKEAPKTTADTKRANSIAKPPLQAKPPVQAKKSAATPPVPAKPSVQAKKAAAKPPVQAEPAVLAKKSAAKPPPALTAAAKPPVVSAKIMAPAPARTTERLPPSDAPAYIAGNGPVVVDIMGSDSGYENQIFWSDDNWKTRHFIGVDNHTASVNLGSFTPGTKIEFGIVNGNNEFYRTGSASSNFDAYQHARVDKVADGVQIGFEDLRGGGDQDFNDAIIRVRSRPRADAPPTPAAPTVAQRPGALTPPTVSAPAVSAPVVGLTPTVRPQRDARLLEQIAPGGPGPDHPSVPAPAAEPGTAAERGSSGNRGAGRSADDLGAGRPSPVLARPEPAVAKPEPAVARSPSRSNEDTKAPSPPAPTPVVSEPSPALGAAKLEPDKRVSKDEDRQAAVVIMPPAVVVAAPTKSVKPPKAKVSVPAPKLSQAPGAI